jgi:NAD(P)-dependent dehydrogenase (short-subunit alcohol dehydrogenase family)
MFKLKRRQSSMVLIVLLLTFSGFAWSATAPKIETADLVAKHLASLGTPEAIAAVKNRVMEGKVTAVFKVAREFGKVMARNNYGRIINTASMYGLVGATASTVGYQAAKGGVVNLTRQIAVEMAKYNVTCNAICPGFFPTPLTKEALSSPEWQSYVKAMVPMNRNGRDGELNAAIVYLASDEASYTTGTATVVDGGYTCM